MRDEEIYGRVVQVRINRLESSWTVATPSFHSPLVSERTPAYLQMTMQDLCAELNQDDPTEIKAIMEIMLSKLMHEVLSGSDKKNVRPSSSLHHP